MTCSEQRKNNQKEDKIIHYVYRNRPAVVIVFVFDLRVQKDKIDAGKHYAEKGKRRAEFILLVALNVVLYYGIYIFFHTDAPPSTALLPPFNNFFSPRIRRIFHTRLKTSIKEAANIKA